MHSAVLNKKTAKFYPNNYQNKTVHVEGTLTLTTWEPFLERYTVCHQVKEQYEKFFDEHSR